MSIFLTVRRRGKFSLATFADHPCLIWHRREDAQHRPGSQAFPADTEALDMLFDYLGTRECYRLHDAIKVGRNPPRARPLEVWGDILETVSFLSIHGEEPATLPNMPEEVGNPPECFDHIPGVHRWTFPGRTLPAVLLASAVRRLPSVVGSVNHPLHGTPEGVWLHPKEALAPGGFSLLDLLALFDVTPDSRTALGVYTCGLFHADSLIQPRPVLCVDSWVRGAGKSTLCQAIASLLDGTPTNIGSVTGTRGYDEIVAHVTGGRRCLISANLDNVRDFQQENLVKFSTDGGCSFRRKYEADMTTVNGVAVMLNLVYGSASLHFDLSERIWRAELTGRERPGPRSKTSDAIARDHRDSIIGHIMAAHARAPEAAVQTVSRFHAFEAAGARAWSEMSGESLDDIHQSLKTMEAGTAALLSEAVASLHSAHPGAVQRLFPDLLAPSSIPVRRGARALGFTFNGTTWEAS